MALVIPNAANTTGGNKYAALDQAEPDALDFEVLGYGGSGVLSGCAVTSNSSTTTVNVAAGVVILDGTAYPVSAAATLAVPAAPTDNRFDIVVARVSAGTASLVVVSGANSSTNPAYPASASVITGAPAALTNVNFATDVVLAALYRSGSATVTTSRIVDKRTIRTISIFNQGTGVPAGGATGNLYYRTGAPVGTASGVYIRTSTGSWVELAQNVGLHLPVGGFFGWPSVNAAPANCLEANGQALATAAYPDLFTAYGYTHGGSGGTFNVPNFNDRYLRGTTSTGLVGTTVGSDTVIIGVANLPVHSHAMAHDHTYAHSHGIDHTHTGSTTGSSSVSVSGTSGSTSALPRIWSGPSVYYNYLDNMRAVASTGGLPTTGDPGWLFGNTAGVGRLPENRDDLWDNGRYYVEDRDPHSHSLSLSGGSHTHTTSTPTYNGSTTSQSASTTSGSSSASTGNTGTGDPIDVKPASRYTRWMIRAS